MQNNPPVPLTVGKMPAGEMHPVPEQCGLRNCGSIWEESKKNHKIIEMSRKCGLQRKVE